MCYAILEIRYIAAGEQDQLLRVSDAEALSVKIADLQSLTTVASIRTFSPLVTLERKVVWEQKE